MKYIKYYINLNIFLQFIEANFISRENKLASMLRLNLNIGSIVTKFNRPVQSNLIQSNIRLNFFVCVCKIKYAKET